MTRIVLWMAALALSVQCSIQPALGGGDCATCPGDLTADGLVDGLDIQTFTTALLNGPLIPPGAACPNGGPAPSPAPRRRPRPRGIKGF